MFQDDNDSMLWHVEAPALVSLAKQVTQMKEEIELKRGKPWISKQQLSAGEMSVEVTLHVVLELGMRRESLRHVARPTIHRGEVLFTDRIMDNLGSALQKEFSDMKAFLGGAENLIVSVDGSEVTAAAAVGAVPEVALDEMSSCSRKRSFSRERKGEKAKKGPEGAEGARVATFRSAQSLTLTSTSGGGQPSDQMVLSIGASSKGLFKKWQIDKLMDWVKKNNFNPSPDLDAIDELVESTGMKPSQVVAWAREAGDRAAKLRTTNGVEKDLEVIIIDDDNDDDEEEDGVPELADEEDGEGWNGLVAGEEMEPHNRKPVALSRNESKLTGSNAEVDLEIGAEKGFDVDIQGENKLSTQSEWSKDYIDEFLERDYLHLDGGADEENDKEDSLPEIAEEFDNWNRLVADNLTDSAPVKPRDGVQMERKVEAGGFEIDFMETLNLLFGLDVECKGPSSFRNKQSGLLEGEKPSAPFVALTESEEMELLEYLSSHLENTGSENGEENLQRPSKRARTDSLDSLFALLD